MIPYPKRLETFLKEVYEKHPKMRRHPDYRMFYLYTSYPKIQESIILMSNEWIPEDDMSSYIITIGNVLGFEVMAMRWDVFNEQLRGQLEKEIEERRGSEYRLSFYEVW